MAAISTEQLHTAATGLDLLDLDAVVGILIEGQVSAADCVSASGREITDAAKAMAATLKGGGTLHYFAAGSSGLMAAADVFELGGTFSIPSAQLKLHMAGGLPQSVEMPGSVEDVTDTLTQIASGLTAQDTAIFISASGSTPYTVAAAELARSSSATRIGIANNPDTPLLDLVDVAICLETPPEVLAGSTRLGAATAQKIVLNTLSTAMAVELGHVHDGMMVNLVADNAKLKQRAKQIVSHITHTSEAVAQNAIDAANGRVKQAVLMASLDVSYAEACELLHRSEGNLRPALEAGKI